MPYEELLGWISYFERRPVGWREDDRTYKLLAVQGVKENPGKLFHSLDVIYNPSKSAMLEGGQIDANSFKKSTMFAKMLTAKGGDKLDL